VRDRDVRAARLEASLVQAKLDSLQSRLQPHFPFNTMNSIGALIHEQPAAGEQMPPNSPRVHRSFIVHADRIHGIEPLFKGDYVITLRDGTKLQSGRTYRERIQQLLR
jgi:LytTr DNA-binding domain/Histidine kinase